MDKTVTCFIPYSEGKSSKSTVSSLRASGDVSKIFIVIPPEHPGAFEDIEADYLRSAGFASTDALKKMAAVADTDYVMTYSKGFPLDLGKFALKRMMQICDNTGAGMVYSDYFEKKNDTLSPHPVVDYQEGSLRDDFNFGSVILYNAGAFTHAVSRMDEDYIFAGLYDLRLKISQGNTLVHIQEMLYTEVETDIRKTGEKQFDYVDPRNRAVQIEMEKACTHHLKCINAWLKPVFREIKFEDQRL